MIVKLLRGLGGRSFVLLSTVLLASLTGLVALPAQERPTPGDPAPDKQVVVVRIDGEIDVVTVRLVQRAIDTARSVGMSRLILDIDTPGGRIDVMREIEIILTALRGQAQGGVRTTAFVSRQALSAGGYLALACDEMFMAPGASIGAITPVVMGLGGIEQIPDDDARRKMLSSFRADVRRLLERRGGVSTDTMKIAEGMVDPTMRIFEVAYIDEGGLETSAVVDAEGLAELERENLRILRRPEIGRTPLTLTADEALRWGISNGTYDSISDLAREELLIEPGAIQTLVPSWSEATVDWLERMKLILFVLGFILLMVEMKVPGLIVPGVLGVLLIGLGLFSSYLVGLAEWTEILLFFLGLGMIGVEIFLMPGTIIFGLLGALSVIASLILSQQSFFLPENANQQDILDANLLNLLYLVLLVMVGAGLFYRLLPKIPFFNRALLPAPAPDRTGDSTRFGSVATAASSALRAEVQGIEGVAVTDLRPAGILERDDGTRLDVVSQGDFIERGRRLRIVDVHGNRIVVEPIAAAGQGDQQGDQEGEVAIGLLVLLVIVGLVMVVAEVFFISGGLLSAVAAVSLISAIFLAFSQHGQGTGFLFLGMAAVGVPMALAFAMRLLPRTAIGRKILLFGPKHEDVTGAAEEEGLRSLLGQEGVTVSMLRPAGFARIGGRRVDVMTRGESIEAEVAVRVIEVEANRVVVAAVRGDADS